MGLISGNASISRYKVNGTMDGPVIETVLKGLKKFSISEIDKEPSEKAVGWTSLATPYQPDFSGSSFVIGSIFSFSLRIDKKSIPSKVLKHQVAMEEAKRLAESGKPFLSRNEKKMIKDHVKNILFLRIPATPNAYDLLWDYEKGMVWFFTTLKSANEELETLFKSSFRLDLIRLFPFTMAELTMDLTDSEKDALSLLNPTHFTG